MQKCLFCQIVNEGELGYVVWEDEKYMAILDKYPQFTGHVLVIPKKHHPYLFEMEESDYLGLMSAVKKIAARLKLVAGAERVLMKLVGVHIPHVHVHLWPERFTGVEKNDLETVAQLIKLDINSG